MTALTRRLGAVLARPAARSSSWAFMGQVAALAAGLVNFLLLAVLLGPRQYGLIAAAWAVVLTVGRIVTLGAEELLARDVTSPGGRTARAFGAALLTTVLGSVVGVLVVCLAGPALLPQVPLSLLAALAVADILALGVATCVTSLFFAVGDARSAGLSSTATSAAKLVGVLLFLAANGADPVQWAWLYAVSAVGSSSVLLVWAIRSQGRPSLDGVHLRERARQGLPFSINKAALVVLSDSDKALLVRFSSASDAGNYAVAYRLAAMASLPLLAVLQVAFPRFYARGHQGGLTATSDLARRMVMPLATYAVVVGTGMAVAGPVVVPMLIGEDYRQAGSLLALMAPLPLIRVLHALASDALTGAGRQTARTGCVVAAAAANLVLNLLLIPDYGVHAAVASTLLTETMYLVCVVEVVRRGLRRTPRRPCVPE
ncbi:MAG: polysaccharide biosynthesis protein [Frankiales bacterium]|nr:polysaccharide biosynthesis protein [Frankiales bacterium]